MRCSEEEEEKHEQLRRSRNLPTNAIFALRTGTLSCAAITRRDELDTREAREKGKREARKVMKK